MKISSKLWHLYFNLNMLGVYYTLYAAIYDIHDVQYRAKPVFRHNTVNQFIYVNHHQWDVSLHLLNSQNQFSWCCKFAEGVLMVTACCVICVRNYMMTSSNGKLLVICAWNSPVTGEFPLQRPVTRSFDIFFGLSLNNRWVNNHEAGDLRRHRAHDDVIVMRWRRLRIGYAKPPPE